MSSDQVMSGQSQANPQESQSRNVLLPRNRTLPSMKLLRSVSWSASNQVQFQDPTQPSFRLPPHNLYQPTYHSQRHARHLSSPATYPSFNNSHSFLETSPLHVNSCLAEVSPSLEQATAEKTVPLLHENLSNTILNGRDALELEPVADSSVSPGTEDVATSSPDSNQPESDRARHVGLLSHVLREMTNIENRLSEDVTFGPGSATRFGLNASLRQKVAELRLVTERMGCTLNILKHHATLQAHTGNIDFKESYHRWVLVPTIRMWLQEARRCQLLDDAHVEGDVRLSVDVTVMLLKMNELVRSYLRTVSRSQLRESYPLVYRSLFHNRRRGRRGRSGGPRGEEDDSEPVGDFIWALRSEVASVAMPDEEAGEGVSPPPRSRSASSSSSDDSSASDEEHIELNFDDDLMWPPTWTRREDDIRDMIRELLVDVDAIRPEKVPETEESSKDQAQQQSPVSGASPTQSSPPSEPLGKNPSLKKTQGIRRQPSLASVGAFRSEEEKEERNVPDFAPYVIKNSASLHRFAAPGEAATSSSSGPHNLPTSEKPCCSNTVVDPSPNVDKEEHTQLLKSSKRTAPDQEVVDIVEKLLLVCPADMLILILRDPEAYLSVSLASKVQHLVECSVAEVQLRSLYLEVKEGELYRQMCQRWVQQSQKSVCAVCLDDSVPCWHRTCCSQRICEACLQAYIAQMVTNGETEMPCPCLSSCRGNLYKSEITVRLSRELHEKYHRFLDNANQNDRRKTCPRCSHLTEMTPATEKALRKAMKHGDKKGVFSVPPTASKRGSGGNFFSRLFHRSKRNSDANNNVSPNGETAVEMKTTTTAMLSPGGSPEPMDVERNAGTTTRRGRGKGGERLHGGLCVTCAQCQLQWCFTCHAPAHYEFSCKEWRHGDKLVKLWADQAQDGGSTTPAVVADLPPLLPPPPPGIPEEINDTWGREAWLQWAAQRGHIEDGVIEQRPVGPTAKRPAPRKARKCPACGIFIERTEGCPHMTCSQCHVEWCYDCGQRRLRIKYIGDHDSKFSIFGCPQRLLPTRPHLRRFIRGGLFVLVLLAAPVVVCLVIGVGIIVLPIVGTGFGILKLYQLIRRRLR